MAASWDDLRVFLSVARHGSLSGAGGVLGLDPATVGRRVLRLETSLGAPLFLKSPQGYALSEAGERFLPKALEVEQAMIGAEDAVRGSDDTLSGSVRVGAPDGCANFLLPQVLGRIAADHPELEVQIVALPRVFSLTRREADLAIAVSQPQAGRLAVEKITDYKLHLAASRTYLKGHRIKDLGDLTGHRMIGYIPDMIYDKELDYLGELGVSRVQMASNSVSVQCNWIKQGAGIGVVHAFAMAGEPEVERVLPEHIELTRSFYMVRPADDLRVHRLNRIAALIARGLRQEVARLERGA